MLANALLNQVTFTYIFCNVFSIKFPSGKGKNLLTVIICQRSSATQAIKQVIFFFTQP